MPNSACSEFPKNLVVLILGRVNSLTVVSDSYLDFDSFDLWRFVDVSTFERTDKLPIERWLIFKLVSFGSKGGFTGTAVTLSQSSGPL